MRSLPVLLLAGFALACNRSDPPQTKTDRPRADAEGAVVTYARRFLFLTGRESAPGAVVFDFGTLSAPRSITRQASVWRARGGKWGGLLDLTWSEEPIREPWRLVPHGPLRLIADERGEVEALVNREQTGAFRLDPAILLGEWNPTATQYQVRRAELRLGTGTPLSGVLFDVQSAAPDTRLAPGSTELFLIDGGELSLILNAPHGTSGQLWIRDGERAEVREGIGFGRDTTRSDAPFRIEAAGGSVRGEFMLRGEALALPRPHATEAVGGEGTPADTLQQVHGWIELGGKRRTLFGVFRRGVA